RFSRDWSSDVCSSDLNEESYQTTNDDNFHRLTAEFKHQFKNKDVLEINPVFSYNKGYFGNKRWRLINNNKVTNHGVYQDTSYQKNTNMDVNILYAKVFSKPGRNLLGNVVINFKEQNKLEDALDSYVSIDSSTSTPTRSTFEQQYFIQQRSGTDGMKASVSFVEPFSDYSMLELRYEFELTDMTAMRRVEDKLKSQE